MKLQIASDLHLEFGCDHSNYEKLLETPADVLILAGDISSSHSIVSNLNEIQKTTGKIVIFVPGNHEYYGTRRRELDGILKNNSRLNKNVHVLIESKLTLDGITFLGSTGWWDGSGGHIGLTVKDALNDFHLIHDIYEDGMDGRSWGDKSRLFFDLELARTTGDIVCISHHLPHPGSIMRRFASSPLNACFVNRWEFMFEEYSPKLWIHGHTHGSFDYEVNNTRIICNPQGYPIIDAMENGDVSMENPDFNPELIVEL